MTRIKLSELSELTAPDSNTSNTFVFVTDVQTGSPVSKKMSVKILDTLMDVTQGQANIAFGQANGAFIQANLAYANANAGLTTANSSFIVANAAFIAANNASKANLAFNHANSGFIQANAAFDTANAAFIVANSAFNQANAGFIQANSGIFHAQSAFIQANAAFTQANNANGNTAANLTLSFGATTILEVLNSGASAYIFTQYGALSNPNISTFSATTLGFKLNVTGHPFHIRTGDNASDYNTGLVHVSSNGTLSYDSAAQGKVDGTLFWRIPHNAIGTYRYRCVNHPGAMIGYINVANTASIYFAYNT